MQNDEGENCSVVLGGGVNLYLVRPPGCKWQITFCERDGYQEEGVGGLMLSPRVSLKNWEGMEFDSKENAAAFVSGEIKSGKVGFVAGRNI